MFAERRDESVPIYTYRCDACGAEIEKRQGFHDEPLTTCEACSGALRRVLHPVGIVFKGSGFYNTDSRKSANSTSAGGGNSEGGKSDGEKSDSGKSDSGSSNTDGSSSSKPAESTAPAKTESSPSTVAATKSD